LKEKARWFYLVSEFNHRQDDGKLIPFPVLIMNFGFEGNGVARLGFQSFERAASFKSERRAYFSISKIPDESRNEKQKLLYELQKHGWEKPLHFDEVWRSIEEMPSFENAEEAEKVFKKLKEDWKKFFPSTSK